MSAISIQGLKKYFGKVKAVDGGVVDQLAVVVLGAVAVFFTCAALAVFCDRDIAVS